MIKKKDLQYMWGIKFSQSLKQLTLSSNVSPAFCAAVIYVTLPPGKHNHQSVDPPIHPSIVPRALRATPNPRTLHPP